MNIKLVMGSGGQGHYPYMLHLMMCLLTEEDAVKATFFDKHVQELSQS